jgi:hypothetical protein
MLMYPKRRWTDGDDLTGINMDQGADTLKSDLRKPRNWIFRMAREIGYRWRIAVGAPYMDRALEMERERAFAERERFAEEYARGYLSGWDECYAACLEAVEDEVSRKNDIWAAGELLTPAGGSLKTN